jgi:rRNA maturation endonuclease Nob1|tara:strand:+ start:165 stop:503 length:339 start_codon:yes stop_codon:yes gene_type:complete
MNDDTDIEMFLKHMQAELEDTSEILDLQARELRQWQIEVAIQEGLKFLNHVEEKRKLGLKNIFMEREAVRIIKKRNSTETTKINREDTLVCPKCDHEMTENLDFCESCGHKL